MNRSMIPCSYLEKYSNEDVYKKNIKISLSIYQIKLQNETKKINLL